MNTGEFVDLLARGAGPAPRAAVARRLGPALVLGALVAFWLALRWPWQPVVLGTTGAVLAAKLAYTAGLAAAALWLTARLARPVARWRGPLALLVSVEAAMLTLALGLLMAASAEDRMALLAREAWLGCALHVLGLAGAMLAAGLWALRGLAPARPRAAGAAVGLLAGAVGACAYSLTCPEPSLVFVALAYSTALLLPTALGAALGPRCLRW